MPRLKISPIERFRAKYEVDPISGCYNWIAGKGSDGYARFGGDNRKTCLAHRWIYEYLNGPIPEGLVVRHQCHNPACVNPEHLLLGTHQDNMDDMVKAGRSSKVSKIKGEKHPLSILTEQDVILIKKFFKRHNGYGVGAFLGGWFNVHPTLIFKIKSGKNWSHLEV